MIPNLTFAIPTFNRSKYLKELLPEVINQYLSRAPGTLEIVVIDNASTDDTEDYIRTNFNQHIRYIRNKENIGGDRNFIECIKNANGKYVWLFGDDEILNPGGIHRVMDAIEKDFDFLITESNMEHSLRFDSYKILLEYLHIADPIFPVHHTLITKNVFPRTAFDINYAMSKLDTNYSHMYGLINHLKISKSLYIFSKIESAFTTRTERAPFAETPTQLEKKLVKLSACIAEQIGYKRLWLNTWLYYNCSPLYNAYNSKKIKRFIKKYFA